MLRPGRIILSVLLVLGLLLLPAAVGYAHDEQQTCPDEEGDTDNRHPSGKDRHCEAGGSGTQGSAQSDPDDDGRGPDRSNGGLDQAGGPGGDDHADQDGNNGCGNDDDFEDDNEGLCLGRQGGQTESNVSGSVVEIPRKNAVLGAGKERSVEEPAVLAETDTAETSVLGAAFTRPSSPPTAVLGVEIVRGQALAATGAPLSVLGLLALGLITSGMVVRRTARRRAR